MLAGKAGSPLGADGARALVRARAGGPWHVPHAATAQPWPRWDADEQAGCAARCVLAGGRGARHNRPLGELGPRTARAWCAHQAKSVCGCAHFAQCAVMLNVGLPAFTPDHGLTAPALRCRSQWHGVALGRRVREGRRSIARAVTRRHRGVPLRQPETRAVEIAQAQPGARIAVRTWCRTHLQCA